MKLSSSQLAVALGCSGLLLALALKRLLPLMGAKASAEERGDRKTRRSNLALKKFNSKGEFLPFSALSYISMAHTAPSLPSTAYWPYGQPQEVFAAAYEFLENSTYIRAVYALTPTYSYHMTVMNLTTQKTDVSLHTWLQNLNKIYYDNEILVWRNLPPFTVRVRDVIYGGALLAEVAVVDPVVEQRLQEFREGAMSRFGIDDTKLVFHITFAYQFQFRKHTPVSDEGIAQEIEALKRILVGKDIVLDTPGLYYLFSMERIVPADVAEQELMYHEISVNIE